MDDRGIINAFIARDEGAVSAVQSKYGAYCYHIALNILCNPEDAEECVNDTWNILWNTIPPTIPASLKAYLGKVVRNQALIRYRAGHAKKRYSGMELMLEELEDCIPSDSDVEAEADRKLLSETVNQWLGTLSQTERDMFLRRYYICEPVKSIAEQYGLSPSKTAQKMMSLRKSLKDYLQKKGL